MDWPTNFRAVGYFEVAARDLSLRPGAWSRVILRKGHAGKFV
jgi:hypothetical protein